MTHVLIVDDSPTEVHVVKTMLTKHGFQVSVAGSGEEGIERAKELLPDIILMDIVMPGMNGFQATRKLSNDAATSHIPIIVVTTKDQDTDRMWALRQGAKDYLSKPVEEDELITKIGEVSGG
ncbi:MAG: response regulator [Gammaproteobacteria bacterium]|nr:response regulator [Gammaproteobacteria bacterium]MCP5136217.1 response regulator [Gammaproteobacteria bacterium]